MTRFNHGCGIEGLSTTPADSLNLTVMSPPYRRLRDFGGHRFGWSEFSNLADQLWRCTKPGGVLCWQEGDTRPNGGYTGDPFRHLLYFTDQLGFNHYETIITNVSDGRNPTRHYAMPPHFLFVLSKGRPNTVNLIGQPNRTAGSPGGYGWRRKDGSYDNRERCVTGEFGVRTCYWQYSAVSHTEKAYRGIDHGGVMHKQVASDLILSYSNRGELVCDPMAGLATVGRACVLQDRNFLGFEIHEPYWRWGQRRLSEARVGRLRASRP